VFENRVLGKESGPEREEITGDWRRLHTGDGRDFYLSQDIIKVIE
jgi:hypothetical protein